MSERFTIGITHDMPAAMGELGLDGVGLGLVKAEPRVDWQLIPEAVDEITPEIAARYDAIVTLRGRYTAASLAGPDRRLALIARFGVGYDRIDVPACDRAGVLVTITPDGVRRPVAQAVLTLVLALAGRLMAKDRLTRDGDWDRVGELNGLGVTGRTLGLVGVGNIGRDVVRLVAPFEMRVLAYDPYARADDLAGLGVELVDAETLFRESDFVSINCPLNEQTHHSVDARRLALMKPTAYLINTARGPIVDEAALYRALAERRIAGAGLDVFEQEPTPRENPILALDNVIVTPHALCWTDECFRGNGEAAFRSCLTLASGQVPPHVVNRAALESPWLRARLERWRASW
jgi:phosphoglycerate dehydrogenase-like enzyme